MKKHLLTVLIIFFILVSAITIIIFVRSRSKPIVQSGTTTGAGYKSLVPGVSTKQDAIKILGTPLNDPSSDTLTFRSNNPNIPNKVVADTDKVVLIKEIVTAKDNKTTNDITDKYGAASYTLYGPDSINGFNLYVYPDKGIAYLGHIKEPIVLEIWYFQPTSTEDFKTRWATEYSETLRLTD